MSKFDLVRFLQHLENDHFGVQDVFTVVVHTTLSVGTSYLGNQRSWAHEILHAASLCQYLESFFWNFEFPFFSIFMEFLRF